MTVSVKVRNDRYTVCNSCPNFNSVIKSCSKCRCIMSVKTWMRKARCPENRWEK